MRGTASRDVSANISANVTVQGRTYTQPFAKLIELPAFPDSSADLKPPPSDLRGGQRTLTVPHPDLTLTGF